MGHGVGRPAGTFANEHQIADAAGGTDLAEEAHLIGGTLNVQFLDHMVPAIVGDEIGILLGADGLLAQEGLAVVFLPIVPSVAQIQVLPQGTAGGEQSFVLGIESAQGIQMPGAAQVQHAGLALQGGAEAAGKIGIEIVIAGLVVLPDGELLIEGTGLGVAVIVQHIRREPVEVVLLAALGGHRDPVLVGQGGGAVSQLDLGLPVIALFGQIGQGIAVPPDPDTVGVVQDGVVCPDVIHGDIAALKAKVPILVLFEVNQSALFKFGRPVAVVVQLAKLGEAVSAQALVHQVIGIGLAGGTQGEGGLQAFQGLLPRQHLVADGLYIAVAAVRGVHQGQIIGPGGIDAVVGGGVDPAVRLLGVAVAGKLQAHGAVAVGGVFQRADVLLKAHPARGPVFRQAVARGVEIL